MIHNIVDTHAHYDEAVFDADRADVLAAQRAAGVCAIINSGSDVPSSQRSVRLAHAYEGVWASVGVFPLSAAGVPQDWLATIEALAADERCVAIGEIGLDYHLEDGVGPSEAQRACQRQVFGAQLALARRLGLPVVIHDRDADDDMLAMLRAAGSVRGVIHRFFSAAHYGFALLEEGLALGIGPAITYANADHLREVVKSMPLERLLLETDAPFLPSARYEGARATSEMIADVCEVIAQVRGDVTPQQAADIACANARRLLGVPTPA